MPPLEIRQYGDPVLTETARPITEIGEYHRDLARDMAETMYEAQGIGIAANQVGVLERIILVDTDWVREENESAGPTNRTPTVMINPHVLEESVEDDTYDEGCLSIPGITGEVWRATKIRVRYTTLAGETVEEECEDLRARCVLHEVDHLDGVLFPDRMGEAARKKIARKLNLLLRARDKRIRRESA